MSSRFIASLFARLFSSATIAETSDGSLAIHSAPGRYVMWVVAFLVVCPLALWCWRRRIGLYYAPSVFVASFAIPVLVVPGLAIESIRVAQDSMIVHTGLWFAPTNYSIPLTDLEVIVEVEEAVAQRAAWRRDTYWMFYYRSGRTGRLDLPELLEANRSHVIRYLRSHGFKVRTALARAGSENGPTEDHGGALKEGFAPKLRKIGVDASPALPSLGFS